MLYYGKLFNCCLHVFKLISYIILISLLKFSLGILELMSSSGLVEIGFNDLSRTIKIVLFIFLWFKHEENGYLNYTKRDFVLIRLLYITKGGL